jgi:predicted dehydrogenase
MLNYFFGGFPTTVTATATTHLDSPVEECCLLVLEYPPNRIGVGLISWLAPRSSEYVAIHGTGQSLYASPKLFLEVNPTMLPEMSLWRNTTERLISMKFPRLTRIGRTRSRSDALWLEIDCFVRHVKDDNTGCSNAFDALNVLIACDAAKKAFGAGRPERISSLQPL